MPERTEPFSGDLSSGSHSSQNNQGKSGKFDNSGGSGGSTNHGFGDDGSSGGFGHSANSDHKSDNDDDKPNAIAEDPFRKLSLFRLTYLTYFVSVESEGETASVLTSGASSSSVVQGTNTATSSQSNPSSESTANTTSTSQTSTTSQRTSATSTTLMANPSPNVNPQTTTPGDSSISPFPTSSSDGNVPSSSNAVNASPLLSHSNAGAIAGGAVGGFVLISTLLFMLIFCLKWRKKRRTPPSAEFVANTREVTSPSFIQIERSNNESDDSLPPFANAGFKDPLYEKIGLSRDLSVAYGLAV